MEALLQCGVQLAVSKLEPMGSAELGTFAEVAIRSIKFVYTVDLHNIVLVRVSML